MTENKLELSAEKPRALPVVVHQDSSADEIAYAFECTVQWLYQITQTADGARRFSDELFEAARKKDPDREIDHFTESAFARSHWLVSQAIDNDKPLLPWMRQWLKMVIDGEYLEVMKRLSIEKEVYPVPDDIVVLLVALARHCGFSVFRNSTSPPFSAIDLAAEVLRRGDGKPASYSGVKWAFTRFRKHQASEGWIRLLEI